MRPVLDPKTQKMTPMVGAFCLGTSSSYHDQELQNILRKLTSLPKNMTDIIISAMITGKYERHDGSVWQAQCRLLKDKDLVALSMKQHKTCVRASAMQVTGLVIPLDGIVKDRWDPANPLHISD